VSTDDTKVDATVTDSLKSEVITKLRSQFLDLANREAEWTVRYGPNHSATVGLRDQMREIKLSMLAELRRIAETYKSDYQIAEEREAGIDRRLASAISETRETNSAQVTMRELESTAQTYRSLYDEFLHRHIATVQQQSLPYIEGRVLSRASRPLRVSWPRASIVYLLSLSLGLLAAVLYALLLDLRSALAAGLSVHKDEKLTEALPAGS
jgi:succinoglycan biosynthesis transport protein ExoP